jgi:hypothetical protein
MLNGPTQRKNSTPLVFVELFLFIFLLFILGAFSSELLYVLGSLAVVLFLSVVVMFTKDFIGRFYDLGVKTKLWLTGVVFSVVLTVAASYFVPVVIPIIASSEHGRRSTLTGLQRGEVKIEERVAVTLLSSSVFMFVTVLLLFLYSTYGGAFLFEGGSFLAFYVLVSLMPMNRFEGSFLAYSSMRLYILVFLLAISFVISLFLGYLLALFVAILFLLLTLASKLMPLMFASRTGREKSAS